MPMDHRRVCTYMVTDSFIHIEGGWSHNSKFPQASHDNMMLATSTGLTEQEVEAYRQPRPEASIMLPAWQRFARQGTDTLAKVWRFGVASISPSIQVPT